MMPGKDRPDAKQIAKDNSRIRKNSARSRTNSEKSVQDPSKVLLTSLSHPQIVAVLERFQLIAKPSFSSEDCFKLLSCNKVFMGYLDQYKIDEIFAIFDSYGNCTDFVSFDGQVNGIFMIIKMVRNTRAAFARMRYRKKMTWMTLTLAVNAQAVVSFFTIVAARNLCHVNCSICFLVLLIL